MNGFMFRDWLTCGLLATGVVMAAVALSQPAYPQGSTHFKSEPPNLAQPHQVEAASPSPELMRALMAFAAARLDLPVPDKLPVIVRKNHCELQAIAYQNDTCAEPGTGALALYSSNVLWLRDDWHADSLKDVSILLHELVHHMQHHAGVPETPCQAEALEKPAYEVQFAFLEAAGVDPFVTIGINALMLLFVTNCIGRN